MSNMNSRTRSRLYPALAARDGEFCAGCSRVGSKDSLLIDHIDNNNSNNGPDNFQLLCRSCNGKKNPRKKSKPLNDSQEVQVPPSSKEVILNERYEPMFREWLESQVRRYERVELGDAIAAGAEVTGASVYTIEKYLRKLCSSAGKFRIEEVEGKKYVEFKEWWYPKK